MGNLNIEIDDNLHTDFKIKCIRKNIEMKEQVARLMKKWVEE